jgi:hypothetical protein
MERPQVNKPRNHATTFLAPLAALAAAGVVFHEAERSPGKPHRSIRGRPTNRHIDAQAKGKRKPHIKPKRKK